MSELTAITQRLTAVETSNKEQTDQLKEAVEILRGVKLALSGDQALGITGIVATAKSAHRRLDEIEKDVAIQQRLDSDRMTEIEEAAKKERWMGRIGSGVIGATVAGIGVWIKTKLGIGE